VPGIKAALQTLSVVGSLAFHQATAVAGGVGMWVIACGQRQCAAACQLQRFRALTLHQACQALGILFAKEPEHGRG